MKNIEPSELSKDEGLLFKKETLCRLFPFHFAFDEKLRFTMLGPSIAKLTGASFGDSINSWLTLVRPQLELDKLAELLLDQPRVVVFGLKNKEQTRLKGEMQCVENGHFIFLGTLWIDSLDRLEDNGLEIVDFSPNDTTVDYLHLIKSHEIASKDFRDLLT